MSTSGKPLPDKLGWKPGMSLCVFGCPEELVPAFAAQAGAEAVTPDVILAFIPERSALPDLMARVLPLYRRSGKLWFAYPKTTGRIPTDITRDAGWEPLAAHQLLGVAQVALDETWSALRFRYRDEIPRLTRQGREGRAEP